MNNKIAFRFFPSFNIISIKNSFVLIFMMEIFYLILVWYGLKFMKLKNCFSFYPPPINLQYNPLMQLRLIFHKTLIKINWKSENFKVIDLVVFQQLRKLWKGEAVRSFCSYRYWHFPFIFFCSFTQFLWSEISLFFFLWFFCKYNKYV